MPKIYVTRERHSELKKELEELKKKGRREIADRLQEAKELGDLSENSEYQEARDEQIRLEQRISQFERVLRNAVIIEKKLKSEGIVEVGSHVKVQKGSGVFTYTIVGSHETNPSKGFISNESPLGTKLLGKKVGDEVCIETPNGNSVYQIVSVE
ncbi:unnamed protein product [marine sediment metagenome]|uniref:Transcription elongation factor GreA n=1 Tax=marine sediment metagenome TaxID=412755 RepID=X1FZE9_9ZZZZ